MTATMPKKAEAKGASLSIRTIPEADVRSPRRPVPRLALSALLVVLAALASAVAYSHATARPSYLALARPVAYGEVITADDLKVVHLGGAESIAAVPARLIDQVIGHTARSSMPAGSLVIPGSILAGPPVGAGQAVTSAVLHAGSFPANLRPGDHVRVISTVDPSGSASGSTGPTPLAEATVLSVTLPRDGIGDPTVSLIVDAAKADAVSAAGAQGRIALILLAV